ncbi:unnamed protein product [Rotaria sp. Silwood2]|nr:unnamed protein product [Rotaria sp. Silwood2]CAF3233092.1 unnamed protein product [Rotaria sp. Silwood2]CAF4066173.1 unnamed protein product [Rotaria sp. Silwood2]CAF4249536.1 unnamed protein product [Rotaria sp. Silwood2]
MNDENNISSMSLEQNLLPYLLSISASHNNIDKLSNYINEYPNLQVFYCFYCNNHCLSHIAAIKKDRWNFSTLDSAFIYKHNHIIHFIKQQKIYLFLTLSASNYDRRTSMDLATAYGHIDVI